MDCRFPAPLGTALVAVLLLSSTARAAQMDSGYSGGRATTAPSLTLLVNARDLAPLPSMAGSSDPSDTDTWSLVAFGPGGGEPKIPVAAARAMYGGLPGDGTFRGVVDSASPEASPVPLPPTAWLLASALALTPFLRHRPGAFAAPSGQKGLA
jgi:hypothetical protein